MHRKQLMMRSPPRRAKLENRTQEMLHRKRLRMQVSGVEWRAPGRRSGSARKEGTALGTPPQDCAVLPGQLWRRFAFFPGGAFGLADGDHEFGLLGRQLPAAG